MPPFNKSFMAAGAAVSGGTSEFLGHTPFDILLSPFLRRNVVWNSKTTDCAAHKPQLCQAFGCISLRINGCTLHNGHVMAGHLGDGATSRPYPWSHLLIS